MILSASKVRPSRSLNGMPKVRNSSAAEPTPTGKSTRPPEILSRTAMSSATRTGLCNGRKKRDRRRVPSVFREVVFARPDIVEAELFGEHRLFQVVPIEVLQRPRTARQLADPHRDD